MAQAVSDARRNAELNGICNATFVQGDLNKIGENFGKDFPKPDVVISGNPFLQILCPDGPSKTCPKKSV